MRLPVLLLLLGILYNSNGVRSQECKENSVFPYSTSNRLYNKCINGKPTLKLCSIGYVFDDGLKSCVLKVTNDNLHGCREGDKEASESCVSYKLCQDGQWVDKYCPLFFKFNPIKKECVKFTEYRCPGQPNNGCESGRTEPVDGRQYRFCVKGKWVLKSCGLGETFDGVACVEEKSSRRVRRASPECEEGHRRRVEGSCRDYVECEGGHYVNKACAACMNFDDESRKCEFFFKYACPSPAPPVPTDPTPEPEPTPSPEPVPPSEPPSSPEPHTLGPSSEVSTQPQPTPSPQPILCKNGEKEPIPGDCSSYQECVNGEYQTNKCSWYRKFDSIEKKCMLWGAKCA